MFQAMPPPAQRIERGNSVATPLLGCLVAFMDDRFRRFRRRSSVKRRSACVFACSRRGVRCDRQCVRAAQGCMTDGYQRVASPICRPPATAVSTSGGPSPFAAAVSGDASTTTVTRFSTTSFGSLPKPGSGCLSWVALGHRSSGPLEAITGSIWRSTHETCFWL